MNLAALAFFVITAVALLSVPRRWAPVALLVSCCYMTIGQGIDLGPFSMPIYRMTLLIGVIRTVIRREWLPGGLNAFDKLLMAWAAWVMLASLFHLWAPGSGPVYASGFIFNVALIYCLCRVWCQDLDDVTHVTRMLGILLVPIAVTMVLEHVQQRNFFAVFGGVPEGIYVRDGVIRSQGPFQHPILAGTVGAVCFPLMVGILHRHRWPAVIGMAACVVITLASSSSGPAMSLIFGIGAIVLWRFRSWLGLAWAGGIVIYIALSIAMTRPAYYVISKFDLTGSSTGWHRARLIEASIQHLGEWWIFGTDKTVHWMGQGLTGAEQHSDLTNYYIFIGVIGGLPAMALVVAMVWRGFRAVGRLARELPERSPHDRFMVWCFGAGLFAHAMTSLSVAYFDQSMIFFWLNVATISSFHTLGMRPEAAGATSTRTPLPAVSHDGRISGRLNRAWAARQDAF